MEIFLIVTLAPVILILATMGLKELLKNASGIIELIAFVGWSFIFMGALYYTGELINIL